MDSALSNAASPSGGGRGKSSWMVPPGELRGPITPRVLSPREKTERGVRRFELLGCSSAPRCVFRPSADVRLECVLSSGRRTGREDALCQVRPTDDPDSNRSSSNRKRGCRRAPLGGPFPWTDKLQQRQVIATAIPKGCNGEAAFRRVERRRLSRRSAGRSLSPLQESHFLRLPHSCPPRTARNQSVVAELARRIQKFAFHAKQPPLSLCLFPQRLHPRGLALLRI